MSDKKNIFAKPRLKAQSGRNPFDLSFKNVFTAPFGVLQPCGFWRIAPNDYVEISNESQLISPQMTRPAFMRLKEHIEYFFVPLSQIWMPMDNFLTAQDYYFSTAVQRIANESSPLSPVVPNVCPIFDAGFYKGVLDYADTQQDIWGFSQMKNSLRLLDLLNYPNISGNSALGDDSISASQAGLDGLPAMNFFVLCAYQKVYYDYFRNSQYETNRVQAYNLDDISTQNHLLDVQDFGLQPDRFFRIFELHYRWLKKDYFTSTQTAAMPNTAMLGFEGVTTGIPQNITTASPVQTFAPTHFGQNPGSLDGPQQVSGTGTSNFNPTNDLRIDLPNPYMPSVSVSAIRFAFAYDKLLRRMREAGQDFDKQMLAQFGIAPVDQRHGKCYRIGGFVNRLNPQSVTDTSSTKLGNIGGKIDSYSINHKPLKFHAKEHGIIIAVHSTSIDTDYARFFVSRDNTANSRFDWYNPAFENLGLQPIFRFELSLGPDADTVDTRQVSREIIGLNRRYSEYKTHVDEVHLGVSRANQTTATIDYQAWSAQKFNLRFAGSGGPLTMRDLVFDPNQLNNIMPVNYNGSYFTDPFIINMYHRFHKVANMSVYGEDFH